MFENNITERIQKLKHEFQKLKKSKNRDNFEDLTGCMMIVHSRAMRY